MSRLQKHDSVVVADGTEEYQVVKIATGLSGIGDNLLDKDRAITICRQKDCASENFNRTFFSTIRHFVNPTYGVQMNQDASSTGTPENVHNGIDNSYWTGSAISGVKWTFDSTDQAKTGTKSVKANRPAVGDVMEFAKGSDLTTANYDTLRLYVYVDSNWSIGDSVELYAWDSALGQKVGNTVVLQDYFNANEFGQWHALNISVNGGNTGLNIDGESTVDAIRIELASKSGPAPLFYVDDVAFLEAGGSIVYEGGPSSSLLTLVAQHIKIVVTDVVGVAELSWNKFMAMTKLENGITYQLIEDDAIVSDFTVRTLEDFFLLGFDLSNQFTDGTNTTLIFNFTLPFPIIIDGDSVLGRQPQIILRDDLTDLVSLKVLFTGIQYFTP